MKVQRFTKVMNFVAYFIYLFKSTDTFEDILAFMSQEKMQAMQKPWMPIQLYYIPKLDIWLKKDKNGFSDSGARKFKLSFTQFFGLIIYSVVM